MNDKIKVLFLDIDNTLLDFDAAAAWAMEQCFQKAGLEYKSEMFAAFTEENNKIWQRIERKELTMDDLFYVRWQAILGHLGLEADGVEMEKEFRILLNLSAVPVDGAEVVLPIVVALLVAGPAVVVVAGATCGLACVSQWNGSKVLFGSAHDGFLAA